MILIVVTSSNSFDLHLKIRKSQPVSDKVLILEVTPNENTEIVIKKLKEKNVLRIYINTFLLESMDSVIVPYSTSEQTENNLFLSIKPDMDGQVRRFSIQTSKHSKELLENLEPNKSYLINLRGPSRTFEHLSFYDLTHVSLEGKSVIIKSSDSINNFTTPLGVLSESEIVANILDNYFENRFVPFSPMLTQALISFLLLIISLILLLYLPSTLALMSSIILAVSYVSISLWFFDSFYLWTPIVTPVIQIVLTFLLISNYKYVLNENTKWNLEKESQYFDEVEEMKTNFLSLFSHDLKTPLSKIIGITDTLMSKTEDSDTKSELEKINSYSRDLEKYIKRILKMSQVQSKNISLNKSPEDINNLIEKSIQQNQLIANEKNIKIEKNLPPLFMVEMDPTLIQEVIINFLENAITYSPENSKIVVSSQETEKYITVSITDQGQGIPKDVQDSIWEKYYRLDDTKAGYGLGLFLSRYVVDLHGGQVFLKSKLGQGSEFGFILPI
ncbi:MAG: CHASE2 domain-containing protein [Bdellovibrionales bacterium]|nr:CHASE2 domain-containing protein [Bdellovibrionales bacterium]